MSRRMLWSCIALVVAILGGSSLLSRQSESTATITSQGSQLVTWVRAHAGVPLGVIGGLVIVWGFRRWRGGRSLGRDADAPDAANESQFADLLDDALHHESHGGREGRRREVLALHRAGHSIGEIARTTRLSQDAVRAVIEAG